MALVPPIWQWALACDWKVSEASAGMAHLCFSRSRILHQARPTSFTWQPPKRASVDAAEHGTQNTTSATFKQVARPAYTVTLQRDTHAGVAGAVSSLNSLLSAAPSIYTAVIGKYLYAHEVLFYKTIAFYLQNYFCFY